MHDFIVLKKDAQPVGTVGAAHEALRVRVIGQPGAAMRSVGGLVEADRLGYCQLEHSRTPGGDLGAVHADRDAVGVGGRRQRTIQRRGQAQGHLGRAERQAERSRDRACAIFEE